MKTHTVAWQSLLKQPIPPKADRRFLLYYRRAAQVSGIIETLNISQMQHDAATNFKFSSAGAVLWSDMIFIF
jgi:hypothetical protein